MRLAWTQFKLSENCLKFKRFQFLLYAFVSAAKRTCGHMLTYFCFWLFAFYFLKASPQMLPFVVAALLQAMQKMLNKWQQCELGLTTYSYKSRQSWLCLLAPAWDTHIFARTVPLCGECDACACGLKVLCCGLFAFALLCLTFHICTELWRTQIFFFCISASLRWASSLACERCWLLCSGWEL